MSSIWDVPGETTPAPAAAGGGGSIWDPPGTAVTKTAASVPHGSGGGILGALGGAAHWVASKADLAAHDIAAIPTGFATIGEALAHPDPNANAEWGALFHGNFGRFWALTKQGDPKGAAILQGIADSTKTAVEHPLRDPFMTATTVLPALNSGARVGLAASDAAAAARAGDLAEAARALVRKPTTTRVVNVPKLVAPQGEGPAALVHEPAVLHASEASLPQLLQRTHDVLLQRALNKNVSGETTRATRYAARRVAKVNDELARQGDRSNAVQVQQLERSSRSFDKGVSAKMGQLALFLRSANVTGEEAARFWRGQAAAGVNPVDTGKLAVLAQKVQDAGLVKLGADGNVAVDGARFPKLGQVDQLVGENQATRADIIREHGLMSPEGMQNRLDLVGRLMAGGKYEAPTAAKLGKSPKLIAATAERDRIAALHQRALDQEQAHLAQRPAAVAETAASVGGKSLPLDNPYRERINNLGSALEVAQARVDRLSKSVQPTGVIGGEEARPGQGYTPLKTSVKRQPQTPFARGRTPVIGGVRSFVTGKRATGEGVASGLIPDNTTAGVARAAREALRYMGTVHRRGLVTRYGSDVRRTSEDVLVADPAADKYAKIPAATREILGQQRSTLNTIPETEHAGVAAGMRARLEDAIPGLRDKFQTDHAAALGTRAPSGYKWVPRQMLGELTHEVTPRGPFERKVDAVNHAVTAATVYFKLSHIPQRLTTNATTAVLSGAGPELGRYYASLLTRRTLGGAMRMREALTDQEYAKAVAASGTHGYMALPHEGAGRVAQVATKGAQFYAHRIDSPVRFVNLYNAARKAGIDTPAKFRELLDYTENPLAERNPQFQHVLFQSNRASMMYDGLGQNEKRILARGLWFYPWTKAAARYGGHVLAEHPLKSSILGQAGQTGVQQQNNILGALPSYEYGLTPFGGGANPKTADFAVLTPFGTAANVLGLVARPGGTAGYLNPVYAAALTASTGINQYGSKTKSPIGDALSELLAPTPEAQILNAYLHPSKPTQIFQKTPGSQALRAAVGPSLPRRTNRAALNSAAARERSGR